MQAAGMSNKTGGGRVQPVNQPSRRRASSRNASSGVHLGWTDDTSPEREAVFSLWHLDFKSQTPCGVSLSHRQNCQIGLSGAISEKGSLEQVFFASAKRVKNVILAEFSYGIPHRIQERQYFPSCWFVTEKPNPSSSLSYDGVFKPFQARAEKLTPA